MQRITTPPREAERTTRRLAEAEARTADHLVAPVEVAVLHGLLAHPDQDVKLSMKKILIILLALGLYGITQAQNVLDVAYMNTPVQLGTPRFAATSGAFTALGNDFSGVHVNPAGIAVFRHDEHGVSMGYGGRTTSSVFYGIEQNGDNSGFIFSY